MSTQHTQGPWAIQRQEGHPYIVADQGKSWKNPLVCSLYEDVTPSDSVTIGPWLEANENAEANARLIAAAPDLLAALQNIVAQYDTVHGVGDMEMQPAIDFAHRAIAKATGAA